MLGGFSRDDYESERLWASAPDGARVPVSLVYRKGLFKRDGTGRMLLHGWARPLLGCLVAWLFGIKGLLKRDGTRRMLLHGWARPSLGCLLAW